MKMVNNTVIYEALAEKYLHSILDISAGVANYKNFSLVTGIF